MAARHFDSGSADPAWEEPAGLALTWLEGEDAPRMMCGDDLTLLWANRAARAELEGNFDLVERDGAILILNRAHQAALATFVSLAGEGTSTFSFPRQNGDGHILFRARRIEGLRARCVGLAFNQTGTEFLVHFAELASIFRLTGAEQGVLDQMLGGFTADEIATATPVTLNTIRSHIRHIYQKLDVTSREELFWRLRPYRL
jgi:DNA-binding CsgD family transcriptional regulator